MQHALLLTLLFATSLAADPSTPADKIQPGRDLLFSTTPRAPAIEEKVVVEADGTLSGKVVTDTINQMLQPQRMTYSTGAGAPHVSLSVGVAWEGSTCEVQPCRMTYNSAGQALPPNVDLDLTAVPIEALWEQIGAPAEELDDIRIVDNPSAEDVVLVLGQHASGQRCAPRSRPRPAAQLSGSNSLSAILSDPPAGCTRVRMSSKQPAASPSKFRPMRAVASATAGACPFGCPF